MLSNGFKFRASSSQTNENGSTYIYLAFSRSSFQKRKGKVDIIDMAFLLDGKPLAVDVAFTQ